MKKALTVNFSSAPNTATAVLNFSGTVRTETRNGVEYLVAPAVLLRAGTFQGSMGKVRYTQEALRSSAEAWNNTPVVLYHPMRNGQPIPAEDADPSQILGFLDNVNVQNGALRGEVFLDMQKLNAQGLESIASTIRNGSMDVSTGLYPEQTGPGDSECDIECLSMTPDHLALLPGGQGACSWPDCGIPRTNKQKESVMNNNDQLEEGIMHPLQNGRTQKEFEDIIEARRYDQAWRNRQNAKTQNQGADDREEGLPLPGQNQQ